MIVTVERGVLRLVRVAARDPADVSHARRPHFEGEPRYACAPHSRGDQCVLVDERAGEVFAMVTYGDGSPVAVTIDEVGLLLAPPAWPLVVLVIAALAAYALGRRRDLDSPWRGPRRLLAAWLLLSGSAVVAYAYAPYV